MSRTPTSPVMHASDILGSGSLCGAKGRAEVRTTADRRKVECKRCRSMFDSQRDATRRKAS